VLWGSNARAAHPIFFHHVLKGITNGARLIVIDPRRTESAEFADRWLGLSIGSDIALVNAVCHELVATGRVDTEFIEHATSGFEAFVAHLDAYSPEVMAPVVGVSASAIRELAAEIGSARKLQLCWTLGITEHHSGVDNVLSLINLALLGGHVGRLGAGLVPLRGQNNVQGGGDMGALPNRLPAFTAIDDPVERPRWEALWEAPVSPVPGSHLSEMFEAMTEGSLDTLWVIGENPASSEADADQGRAALANLDTLVVSDIYLTATAEIADVVLPALAGWAETEGTVTSSERRVQRVRAVVEGPAGARSDLDIICEVAQRMGHLWLNRTPESLWDELRSVSSMHGGMSYERLEANDGLQWPCPHLDHPGSPILHDRLWDRPVTGPRAGFTMVDWRPPRDALDDRFPIRLTTGRRLDSYNTGVQTAAMASPIRGGSELDVHPQDLKTLGLADGDRALVSSRRASVEMVVRSSDSVSPGEVFTTFHFQDSVDVNRLISADWDPKSGTAEFKATAVRIEPTSRADAPSGGGHGEG
jgi:predicted molibdopterin-dependent oxidoreductase YjgC